MIFFVKYVDEWRGSMDIDIRKAVIANMKNNDSEQLEQTILEAIDRHEEKTLPGLGVLFELIWESSETQQKEDMIQALEEGIHTDSMSN